MNLTLSGDSDTQAVYSVSMTLGHGPQSGADVAFPSRIGRRDSTGSNAQTVNLQIDLGSSDLVSAHVRYQIRLTQISSGWHQILAQPQTVHQHRCCSMGPSRLTLV